MNPQFIPIGEFCQIFELNIDAVKSGRATGRLPSEMFLKDKESLLIDYKYAQKRAEFRKKIWLQAHDLYYEIMDLFSSQTDLSKMLSKLDCEESPYTVWNTWLTSDLFCDIEDDKLSLKPRAKDYKFVRFARWLISIHKRTGLDYKARSKRLKQIEKISA